MGRTPLENAWACRSIQGSPYPAGRVITDYYEHNGFCGEGACPVGSRSGPNPVNQALWFCDCCAVERGGAAFRQAPSPQALPPTVRITLRLAVTEQRPR